MGKVTKKIMKIGQVLLLCLSFPLLLFSQKEYKLNGTFEGRHIEFTEDGSNDSLIYIYILELKQEDQVVKGKSYIYNDEGYYAVVQLRGVILKNQFYFEEYETLDEINPEENHWCYTSGHLDILKDGDKISLTGFTRSHTKQYGALCRLGYTDISTFKENEASSEAHENLTVTDLTVQPNPTEAMTTISFTLSTEEMTIIEVYDLGGELITEVLRRNLLPGSYSFPIDLSFKKDGMYIVELIVDRKLYTTEVWKTRR
jgi:hypothetical protein